MQGLSAFGNGIYAVDSGYTGPDVAAIHLIEEGGRAALVDTGNNDALVHVEQALAETGLSPEAVDLVLLTHIHLDHAGGAGAFMQAFPNAKLVVHPRGARHMAEPSKLVAGVTAVYGAEYVNQVYGNILPIPAERIIEAADGFTLSLAGRELLCIDTPGHARHHICIVDKKTGGIFTGDMFGLSYREHDVDGRPFIFPTTTPTQFEPDEMRASISRLLSFKPEAMYLTHYSRVGDVPALGEDLLRRLDALVAIAESASQLSGKLRHEQIKAEIATYLFGELKAHGCNLAETVVLDIWATDLELNAQGLEVWLDSRA